jgi:hypothetical protein
MTMPEITVTTTATFDPQAIWYEMSMPASAISYWARGLMVTDAGIGLHERGGVAHEATWQEVGNAIALMASGQFVDHTGTTKRLGNDYAVRACSDMIHDPESADWDAEVDDLIFQMALLGKVVYG